VRGGGKKKCRLEFTREIKNGKLGDKNLVKKNKKRNRESNINTKDPHEEVFELKSLVKIWWR